MKTNDAGLNLIKSFEGCHLAAYQCPAGVWTIGYGHTGTVDGKVICEGMTITEAKATELLKQDLKKFENAVTNAALTFEPNENQFSALVSFAFNCGTGNLKKLVKDRSAAVVAEKILLYNKSNGQVLKGLVRRREAERELFLKGVEDMAVKIGHASIDENKKIKGGASGDQTGGEVCTRKYYKNQWNFVLRPKSASLAEKSAKACEDACANKNIGYDQNQRNTLYEQARKVDFDLSKITVPCECDCSSLMHVCALAGGANITYGSNGAATINMKSRFTVNGEYEVLTDSKYLTSDKLLKRGDILVKEGSHTVMILEDGSVVSKMETTTESGVANNAPEGNDFDMPTIKKGSKGKAVKVWQIIVGVEADGDFGSKTKTATIEFQRKYKLVQDGIVGENTWKVGLETLS